MPIDVPYRVDGEAGEPPTALVPLATMLTQLASFAERIEALAIEVGTLRSDLAHVTDERDALQTRLTSATAMLETAEATAHQRLDVIDELREAAAERDRLRARVAELEAEREATAAEFAAAPAEPATVAPALEPEDDADAPDEAAVGRPGVIRRWWTWLVGESA